MFNISLISEKELNNTVIQAALDPQTAPSCFEWCANQHVHGMNAINNEMAILVILAYLSLQGYILLRSSEKYQWLSKTLLSGSKSMMLIFMLLYVLWIWFNWHF